MSDDERKRHLASGPNLAVTERRRARPMNSCLLTTHFGEYAFPTGPRDPNPVVGPHQMSALNPQHGVLYKGRPSQPRGRSAAPHTNESWGERHCVAVESWSLEFTARIQ